MTTNRPFSNRRVLLVEDEMLVAWLIEDMLADLGCAVIGPASSVNQALAMIDAEAIDAAVLDLNLDGQMSYPVADVLAAHGVPFVISTGYDKDTLPDDYRARPVLQKPMQRSELSDALAKLLTPKEPSVESVIAAPAEMSF
jgi:CheY-like chemotaxis protein